MSLTIILILTMLTLVACAYAPLPFIHTLSAHRKAVVSAKQSGARQHNAAEQPDIQE